MAIEGDDVVKSVGRVFEILQLLDAERRPLSATQVERGLGYPQSSTLALLKSMVKLGYLAFDRLERCYVPTMRVAGLGRWIEASFHGEGHLVAMLDEISAQTSETVCLSCQNDLAMQFTHVRLSPQSLIMSSTAGDLAPLFSSAIGLAALSDRQDPVVRKLVQRYNRRCRNSAERVDAETTLQRIRRVRVAGYAVGYDMYLEGIGAIAWPLRPEAGPHAMVLSVGGPTDRIKAREASIIRTTRAAIRAHLGG